MKNLILLLLLSSLQIPSHAQQDPPRDPKECASQIQYGVPISKKQSTTTICRRAYILEHDNNAKIPIWVSYVLTPEHATGCFPRSNAFSSDKSLPIGKRSELKDYAKSGYDIGHLANDSDMSWDYNVEIESFILSNMSPQLPGFNRGIWKKLEDQTRAWTIDRNNPLQIYTGPIYSVQDKTIGQNNVVVPSGFYKIIIDTKTREGLVFLFKHEPSQEPLSKFLTSLAEVQKYSGIVFPVPTNFKASNDIWPAQSKNATKVKRGVCALKS